MNFAKGHPGAPGEFALHFEFAELRMVAVRKDSLASAIEPGRRPSR